MSIPNRLDHEILQDYVDGELDSISRIEVARHLGETPEDAEIVEDYRRQNELIRELYDPVMIEPVPEKLAHAVDQPRTRWSNWTRYAAAAAVAVVFLFAGWEGRKWYEATEQERLVLADFLDQAVNSYAYYPFDSDRGNVSEQLRTHLPKWFKEALRQEITPFSLEKAGYSLAGGRVVPSAFGPAGQMMYRGKDDMMIGVYIRPLVSGDRRIIFPLRSSPDDEVAFHFAREKTTVYYWSEGNLAFAFTGNIDRKELFSLVKSIRKAAAK